MGKPRKVPRPFSMPWGAGQVVEECGVDSELVIQLLQYDDRPEPTLRFCQYWSDGRFQRQPMMLPEAHIDAMRRAIKDAPGIHALLRRLVDES